MRLMIKEMCAGRRFGLVMRPVRDSELVGWMITISRHALSVLG